MIIDQKLADGNALIALAIAIHALGPATQRIHAGTKGSLEVSLF
jgi:hypothetical protein